MTLKMFTNQGKRMPARLLEVWASGHSCEELTENVVCVCTPGWITMERAGFLPWPEPKEKSWKM